LQQLYKIHKIGNVHFIKWMSVSWNRCPYNLFSSKFTIWTNFTIWILNIQFMKWVISLCECDINISSRLLFVRSSIKSAKSGHFIPSSKNVHLKTRTLCICTIIYTIHIAYIVNISYTPKYKFKVNNDFICLLYLT